MKDSAITCTDLFCGAGGSSIGAQKVLEKRGGKVALALNHWKLAIETHNTNFKNTIHDCTDISACNPKRYPSTNILIGSPECTNHTPAKGQKEVKMQLDLFDSGLIDPSAERSRATMWDIPRFAEYHRYEIIIVENVVEARKWIQYPAWLMAMDLLGYKHKAVYANSMHFQPTPQSRDRMYVVFWKKGNKAPDLELTPKAFCPKCNCVVDSRQAWKNSQIKYGKYKQQYVYICPSCIGLVEPYYHAAFNVIDWSNIGTRIGDRKKPLCENTERRIKFGMAKYGDDTFDLSEYTVSSPLIIKAEHTKTKDPMVRSAFESMQTQCTRQTIGLALPPSFIVENKGKSNCREITSPAATITTVPYLGVLANESWKSFIHYNYGQTTLSQIKAPLGSIVTKEKHSLVNFKNANYEDCYYRMLLRYEIQKAMAFDSDYIVCGNGKEQVRQLGNAVTPPAMEWLIDRTVQSLEN